MMLHALALLASLALAGVDRVIDDFEYADEAAARQAWLDNGERGESSPVTMVDDGNGRRVLQLAAPFASQPNLGRVYIDRKVDLDLAGAGEFTLELATSSPEAAGRLSLYFHAGGGWYAAGAGLSADGWRTLRFSKTAFTIEDEPVGWHKIDAIRIAVWRGQAIDFHVRLRRLTAARHDVAVVIPVEGHSEHKTSLDTASYVAELIAELGLGSDAVQESDLAHGALGDRRVAILAYNPRLSDKAADALVQFVDRGGKLLVCYQLPAKLGAALGFGNPQYVGKKQNGQFAEIRFDAPDIGGLPSSVKQASWNITTAEPANHQARVIGRWYDSTGQATGHAAMLLSDRGAFFSHLILRDDRAGKMQMLAAVLGHLAPTLWKQMAESQLADMSQVGHLDDLDELAKFLTSADHADARKHYETGVKTLSNARAAFDRQAYDRVGGLAHEAHEELVQAYLLAQASPKTEGRAFWNHSGTGAYEGDWDRTARELAAAGFNMILPNMLWGGRAHYPSDVLPRSNTYARLGDQIAQCVAASHKVGLEVHVWKVNFNLSGAPREFVERIHREHRNQVSVDGEDHDWLCPSHPENFALELESMLEVARKYPVDGLHFDYIRYPGRDKCYCDGCRQRFEVDLGRKVGDWPADCYAGELKEQYAGWRCDQITRLVRAVHEQARTIRPSIKISAAVFGAYPDCRASVAQDWPEWIKAGYLDFVCPMDYTQSDEMFIGLVSNQLRLVAGRTPIYPGIGQWRLSDDRTVGQIHHARQLGAAGFTIFNLTGDSAESVVPAIAIGVGRQTAVPPHRTAKQVEEDKP